MRFLEPGGLISTTRGYGRCPLRGPQKNGQKVVREWFWAFSNDMPKKWSESAQKVVQKWPQQDLGANNCPKCCKKVIKKMFFGRSRWRPSAATQEGARRPSAAAPTFGPLFIKKPKRKLCFSGTGFCMDPFVTTFWALHLGGTKTHSWTTFWPLFFWALQGDIAHISPNHCFGLGPKQWSGPPSLADGRPRPAMQCPTPGQGPVSARESRP